MVWGGRHGQVSIEYLLIVGFALLMLLPLIIISFTQSGSFQTDVTAAQVQKVGNSVVDAVNAVYYACPPTKKTIKVYFPKGIESVDVDENKLLFTVFGEGGKYEYAVYAETNMSGAIESFSGLHVLSVTAGDTNVTIQES